MKNRQRFVECCIAAALVGVGWRQTIASPIIIDDFSTGPFRSYQLFTPEERAANNRLGNVRLGGRQFGLSVPGRSRDVVLASILYSNRETETFEALIEVDTSLEQLHLDTSIAAEGLVIRYGNRDLPMHVDISSSEHRFLELSFSTFHTWKNTPGEWRLSLGTRNGEENTSGTVTTRIPPSDEAQKILVPISDFVQASNNQLFLDNVTSLLIQVSSPGHRFQLDRIAFVPEPSHSAALLGMTILLVFRMTCLNENKSPDRLSTKCGGPRRTLLNVSKNVVLSRATQPTFWQPRSVRLE